MENKPQFQRKTIIVKRNLQYRYMFIISFTSLVAFMLVALDVIWNIYKVVEEHPGMIPMLDEIFSNMPLMAFKLVIYILIVVIASAVISHKIAGPVYKFEKSCEKISQGDIAHRVYLRKGDSLIELQEAFNNMMEKIQSVIKVNEDLKKYLLEKNIEKEKIEETDKKIKEIMPEFKL
ncbi:MAG TPA: methyl-accepting chemotaxis protein [Elusimicrobiales bacterium]|nr:methyl-accepting chemotaxis protein [Elusimicrobiales bacterium]HOL62532.1 methyl-accepting chemotaxis protein [Elusimicrobiales bacterium]HPO95867.1 methyl-accepting chemotaxis protein [Elusimicrobiales bacterium]